MSASERGTRYHSVMEHLDYHDFDSYWDSLPEETKKNVRRGDIDAFLKSDLGRMCAKAGDEGRLYRERQFIMGISAREAGEADSDETVLVQGIIDAFIDGDELVLIDYKTDRVDDEKTLIDRYAGQLYYYRMALEKLKGKPVDRVVIWSFALGKAVEPDCLTKPGTDSSIVTNSNKQ